MPRITRQYSRDTSTEYGGSYRRYFYFAAGTTEEEARSLLWGGEGTSCQHAYDCCGRYYASRARVFRSRTGRLALYQDWRANV